MSSEYLDWTALESASASLPTSANVTPGVVSATASSTINSEAAQRSLTDLLEMESVPDELKQLVTRQQALEQELDELTGHRVTSDWNDQRFSLPQHTAESRLADKQRTQRQESHRSQVRQQINQRALSRLKLDRGLQQAELARQEKLKHKKCQALQLQQRLTQLEQDKHRVQREHAQRRLTEAQRQREQNDQRQQRILQQALQHRQDLLKEDQSNRQKRQRLELACWLQRQEQQHWQWQRDRQQQARQAAIMRARSAEQQQQDILMAQQHKAEVKREQRLAERLLERQAERLATRRRLAQQEKKAFFS